MPLKQISLLSITITYRFCLFMGLHISWDFHWYFLITLLDFPIPPTCLQVPVLCTVPGPFSSWDIHSMEGFLVWVLVLFYLLYFLFLAFEISFSPVVLSLYWIFHIMHDFISFSFCVFEYTHILSSVSGILSYCIPYSYYGCDKTP